MTKRKIKYWHLSDFKETGKFMYIVFEKEYHQKFYSTAIKVAGGQRKLAKKVGFYSSRINNSGVDTANGIVWANGTTYFNFSKIPNIS